MWVCVELVSVLYRYVFVRKSKFQNGKVCLGIRVSGWLSKSVCVYIMRISASVHDNLCVCLCHCVFICVWQRCVCCCVCDSNCLSVWHPVFNLLWRTIVLMHFLLFLSNAVFRLIFLECHLWWFYSAKNLPNFRKRKSGNKILKPSWTNFLFFLTFLSLTSKFHLVNFLKKFIWPWSTFFDKNILFYLHCSNFSHLKIFLWRWVQF